jgi:hypothetical protein
MLSRPARSAAASTAATSSPQALLPLFAKNATSQAPPPPSALIAESIRFSPIPPSLLPPHFSTRCTMPTSDPFHNPKTHLDGWWHRFVTCADSAIRFAPRSNAAIVTSPGREPRETRPRPSRFFIPRAPKVRHMATTVPALPTPSLAQLPTPQGCNDTAMDNAPAQIAHFTTTLQGSSQDTLFDSNTISCFTAYQGIVHGLGLLHLYP